MPARADSKTRNFITRSCWLLLSAAIAVEFVPAAGAQEPPLPKAPPAVASAPTRIVIALPDSGGFAINNQPVRAQDLESQLVAVFQDRPTRILLVSRNPGQRSEDLRTLIGLARRIGITLYESPESPAARVPSPSGN